MYPSDLTETLIPHHFAALLKQLPEFNTYFEYIRGLGRNQVPDYAYLRTLF